MELRFERAASALLLAATATVATHAQPPAADALPDRSAYERLQELRFSAPIEVPAEGIAWRLDTARFELRSGRLWLLEPIGGVHTGLVFEGDGRFELAVPDRYEERQLRRFAEDPELRGLDAGLGRLVLRWAPDFAPDLAALSAAPAPSGGDPARSLARDRRQLALLRHRHDADARVLAALRNPGDRYLRAEMDTERFGWLTYTWDELAREEVEVSRLDSARGVVESWLSLDRAADRREDGRPGDTLRREARLVRFDAAVDLTSLGKGFTRGVGAVNPIDARFVTTASYEIERDGVTALQLELHPLAVVSAVRREGRELDFLRFNVGRLESAFDNRIHLADLVVLLDREVAVGDTVVLEIGYQLELPGFASLLSWYPRPRGMGLELHEARIAATHRRDYGFRATGSPVEERANDDGTVTSIWETARPIDAAGFTFAQSPWEKRYEHEGLPDVVMFGTQRGYLSADKIESFSPDIINSIHFFQNLLGTPVSSDQVFVTLIASGHGQAGSGLIHVSDGIAQAGAAGFGNVGSREAFLAHEVAHEWWGHQLSWASYRHQWLSEGLAEYSSMMFVEASLDNGPRVFQKMLAAYTDELTGSISSLFGAFGRPGLALDNKAARNRIGPIGHGFRAAVAEAPAAYVSMAYTKGAMVAHMLRTILRTITKSDATFVAVLRDLVAAHQGQAVSTEDFQAVLTKHAPSDWTWFFDQWVYGTAIPSFSWKHQVKPAEGGAFQLVLEVEMSDVPPGWKTPVPVRAEFGKDRQGDLLVMVDEPSKRFELRLPERPTKVIFNPDHAIVAKMK
ncbi:MAG TPA: M1 family aminopeptidase [Thermoanaerobaculia bacterium]|nr:M1 family aminopeptidase [Thermoanaerobaculia bacterium]